MTERHRGEGQRGRTQAERTAAPDDHPREREREGHLGGHVRGGGRRDGRPVRAQ